MKHFTQPAILEQIGRRRLVKLFQPFEQELKANNLVLPNAALENGTYFRDLATVLGRPQSLPETLRKALFTLEAAASPENDQRLWTAIRRRIPSIGVSQDCPLDRALELWFVAPDEFPQFPKPDASTLPRSNAPTTEPNAPDEFPQFTPANASTLQPSTAPTINSADALTLPHSDTPTPRNSDTPSTLPLSDTPTPPLSDSESFLRLAAFTPAQYDRVRHAEATRLGIRLETLDAEVTRCRLEADYDAQARAVKLPLIEPWPEPVDGAEVLHQVLARFVRAVILPPGAPVVLALWPAHAHAFDAFLHTPRLNLTSAEAECGKTTTLDLLATMTPRALRTEHLTAPVLFRLVAQHQPTLLLDEIDSYLPYAEELRGMLNAGHKQGACAYRCEGQGNAVRAFNAFAPAVLSGIGPLPDTLRSRSIRILLLKAEPEQITARFDSRHTEIEKVLCRKLARWAQDNFAALQTCDPPMPPTAYNRVADNWRPLFAIAHTVGADWPALALDAYEHLTRRPNSSTQPDHTQHSTNNSQPLDSSAVELLKHIRQIFTQSGGTRISSKQLIESLRALPGGRYGLSSDLCPLSSASRLARRLRPFGITSRVMRFGVTTAKGYDLADFIAAFARFLNS